MEGIRTHPWTNFNFPEPISFASTDTEISAQTPDRNVVPMETTEIYTEQPVPLMAAYAAAAEAMGVTTGVAPGTYGLPARLGMNRLSPVSEDERHFSLNNRDIN